jgi:hypothetical protein
MSPKLKRSLNTLLRSLEPTKVNVWAELMLVSIPSQGREIDKRAGLRVQPFEVFGEKSLARTFLLRRVSISLNQAVIWFQLGMHWDAKLRSSLYASLSTLRQLLSASPPRVFPLLRVLNPA